MIPVTITSSESTIRGYFFPSVTHSAIATVIFLQGFPGTEGDELICERLAHRRMNVLTFNYRGTFRSEGYFSFSNAVSDIGAALRFIKDPSNLRPHQIDPEKIILGGWSFGAAIVPTGAIEYPEFAKVFAISGRDFGKEARRIERDPEYAEQVMKNLESIRVPNGPVRFRDDLLAELREKQAAFDLLKLAALMKDHDILLIGSSDDEIVPIEDHIFPFYQALVENGTNRVKFRALQDDHEFAESRDQLAQIISNWLSES